MKCRRWIEALGELFYPRLCVVCGNRLAEGEEVICTSCNIHLPRTNQYLYRNNEVEKIFWGKVHLERAASFFYYSKGSSYNRMIHLLKYRGKKELGENLGKMCAQELQQKDFWEGIDLLIPVPLHKDREKKRGYNQSEYLARGISELTGIPCCTSLVKRVVNTDTQIHQTVFERMENISGAFEWESHVAESLAGKHLLLIDDVLTTGSTLLSCISALPGKDRIRVSIFTLCMAH